MSKKVKTAHFPFLVTVKIYEKKKNEAFLISKNQTTPSLGNYLFVMISRNC